MRRGRVRLGLLLLALLGTLGSVAQAAPQPRGYVKGEGYAYFSIGSYPYSAQGAPQPLLWRALAVENGCALLWTDKVIDARQVIFETDETVIAARSYRRLETFAQSDLCGWLNNTLLPMMLADTGLAEALVAGDFGKLYPLTDRQLLTPAYGFSTARYGESPQRCGQATPYAKAQGVYSDRLGNAPYWVATVKAADDYKLQIVGYNGHLSYGAYTRDNIGIRPAMTLNLALCQIIGGDGTANDPYCVALRQGEPVGGTETPAANDPSLAVPTASAPTATPPPASAATIPTDAESTVPSTISAAIPAAQADSPAVAAQPSSTQTPSVGEAETQQALCTLSLLGDISPGDAYQYRGRAGSLTVAIANNGMAWPLAQLSGILQADSLTVANLEACLTERTDPNGKKFPLIAPPTYGQVLTQGGVDAVNTINNHSFDFGTQGYHDTLAALENEGIGHFGTLIAGDGTLNGQTLILTRQGIRFGFAGYSYPQNSTLEAIGEQVAQLRAQGCQVVVISLHWGRETFTTPKSGQPGYAAKIIDLGADVVWGHHPHVLQPVQFYRGKPILFSTGNVLFGTMSKVEPSTGIFQLEYELTDTGAVLRQLTVVPCMTQRAPEYQPYVLEDAAAREAVWALLRAGKTYTGYENLPERFLTTGTVRFDSQGNMLAD